MRIVHGDSADQVGVRLALDAERKARKTRRDASTIKETKSAEVLLVGATKQIVWTHALQYTV